MKKLLLAATLTSLVGCGSSSTDTVTDPRDGYLWQELERSEVPNYKTTQTIGLVNEDYILFYDYNFTPETIKTLTHKDNGSANHRFTESITSKSKTTENSIRPERYAEDEAKISYKRDYENNETSWSTELASEFGLDWTSIDATVVYNGGNEFVKTSIIGSDFIYRCSGVIAESVHECDVMDASNIIIETIEVAAPSVAYSGYPDLNKDDQYDRHYADSYLISMRGYGLY